MEKVRTVSGLELVAGSFKFLQSDFSSSYAHAIRQFKDDPFLRVINKGLIKQVTYAEFDRDVRGVSIESMAGIENSDLYILEAENDYDSVLKVFAALLAGKTLVLFNPKESAAQKQRKLDRLRSYSRPPSGKGEDFIYVFTSGSTGDAKFVRQREQGVLANIEALIQHHNLGKRRTILTPLPIFHVNALEFVVFSGFFSGSQVVLCDSVNPRDLQALAFQFQPEVLNLIPPVLRGWLDFLESKNETLPSSVGYIVTAATALPKETVLKCLRTTGLKVIQGYGLSEAVNFSLTMPVDLSNDEYLRLMTAEKYTCVGVPLWGNEISVLDESGKVCGERSAGEICIRGFSVMAGYLGESADITFRDGYLHSGDLGFFVVHSGLRYFYISGRKREMIKRNGATIPLREIDDQVLALSTPWLDAMAVGFSNLATGEELGLICTISGDAPEGWEKILTEALVNHFESAERPRVVICLASGEKFRTPSGKPMRYKYIDLFESYHDQNLGSIPVVIQHDT